MGAVNSLLSEIQARLGNRQDVATSRSLLWLNFSYYELLLTPKYDFHEIEDIYSLNTVAGTANYFFTSFVSSADTIWSILSVKDATSEYKLRKSTYFEYDKLNTTVTGKPVKYFRYKSQLVIYPTPNAVYQLNVRIRFRPAALVTGGSTITATEWDEPLVQLSVVKGLEALKQKEEAGQQRELYNEMMIRRQDTFELDDEDADYNLKVRVNDKVFTNG